MNLEPYLQSIYDLPIAVVIREGETMFPWMETVHVIAIAIVVGTIAIVDLRLIGYPSHRRGARKLIIELLPFTWIAFVAAVISGLLLFSSNALTYAENGPFQAKMVALLAAGMNMAIFHLTAYRRIVDWDDMLPPPLPARIAGATSLGLWILVIFLGRWIGFSMD